MYFWRNSNYINITVYAAFFFYLSELMCDSPFALNTASLSCLPISGNYLSRFSINISDLHRPTQELLFEDSKPQSDKDQKSEDKKLDHV